jgi:ATP-binding cassette subfamily E protein 1
VYLEPAGHNPSKGVRVGISQYLKGFLPRRTCEPEANQSRFEVRAPRIEKDIPSLVSMVRSPRYSSFACKLSPAKYVVVRL